MKTNRPIAIINGKPYRNITEIETSYHLGASKTIVYRNDKYLMTIYNIERQYGETKMGRPILCLYGQEFFIPVPPFPFR